MITFMESNKKKYIRRNAKGKIVILGLIIIFQSDAYQATGCYNLLCSGFVQTNNRIAIGAAISPTSSYNGGQFDISLVIWKVLFFFFFFFLLLIMRLTLITLCLCLFLSFFSIFLLILF